MPLLIRREKRDWNPVKMFRPLQKGKDEKRIMVLKVDKLFGKYRGRHFEGFMPTGNYDFGKIILDNYIWMPRKAAETNFEFKQPIPYALIFNSRSGKFFTYRRAPKSGEARLAGKLSIGIGGHVEPQDRDIMASLLRELREEVTCSYETLRRVGFINVNEDDVGKVHFGLCYVVETSTDVTINDPHLEEGCMMSLDEIENNYENLETWSKVAFDYIKNTIVQ